jgi:hypothetical protein
MPVKALDQMLAQMSPDLAPDTYVFATAPAVPSGLVPLMAFREDEGLTLVITADQARDHGWPADLPMRQITLRVHSALDGVGLTAAFSSALAAAGISCNVVAGYHHDHIFVPEADAERALTALRALSGQHRAAASRTTGRPMTETRTVATTAHVVTPRWPSAPSSRRLVRAGQTAAGGPATTTSMSRDGTPRRAAVGGGGPCACQGTSR